MIAYTTFLLFFIGIFSSIKVGAKVDKILSFFTFASIFFVFLNFCDASNMLKEHVFTFTWSAVSGNNLKFDIISNSYNYWLVLPCFALTMLSVLNSLFFNYEEKKSAYISVLIFNLVALIILITSNNFVQLLSALFIIDVLAVFMIKNIEASQRFVLLNVFADIILFTVLAVINCRVDSLDMKQIILYRNIGLHQDFVGLAGLTAVFAKLGFFFFQIGITGLTKIRFHRLQNILFISSPMAALILLLKFSALWRTSEYFTIYMDIMCIISIIWGGIGALLVDNIKSKVIYWQMSFWALFLELLRFHGFIWFSGFTFLLLEMYVIVLSIYMIYYYKNRQVSVVQMRNFFLINKKFYAFILLVITAVIAAMSNTLTILYNNMNRYYIWTFAVVFMLSLSTVLKQILNCKSTKIIISEVIPAKKFVLFELVLLCLFLLQNWHYAEPSVWGGAVVFALLCAYNPLEMVYKIYNFESLKNVDVFGGIYHVLIKSLRLSGRVFWLLIDRLFVEKIVLSMLISTIRTILSIFRKLHTGRLGVILAFVLAILLLFGVYYIRRNEL